MARIKKEDEFFTLLKDFAALIVETSEEYAGIVHDFPNSMSRIPQMKVYETNCDDRVKTIMSKLYTSFITPLDREDISNLALAMDNVTDAMSRACPAPRPTRRPRPSWAPAPPRTRAP